MVTIPQMNLNKLTIIATLIIASTATVAASPAEITVFPEDSEVRIDSDTSYEATIENVGPAEDTYTFTSSSTSEIDIAPRQVNLEPGQSETVYVWYNPSQDREEGTYTNTITATSRATGDQYTGQITASVIRDYDVNLDVERTTQTVCRGETATYNIQVTNDGIQQEEYQLDTDFGELSQNTVTLEDGETKTVQLSASSDTPTTENFNVRATSTTSYAQDIQNIQFVTETCYSSETEVTPTQGEVAGGAQTSFDVTIRNTGTQEDEFSLSTNNGQFTENPVTVDGESSETVQLQVTPEELGEQTINIESSGRSQSTAQANLNVYNGNDMEVGYVNSGKTVCQEQDTVELETRVENTGETSENYSISTSTGTLQTQEVELDVGESDTVTTTIDSTEIEVGEKTATTTVTATTYDGPEKSASNTFTVEDCYDVSINIVPQVASAGENRSVIYDIKVSNTGTRGNTYQITQNGPDWVSIKPEELTISPGQTDTAYMYAGIPFKKQGNVQVKATATGNQSTDSQTVELVIDQEIEEAIQSNQGGNSITGQFTQSLTQSGTATKAVLAILLAAVITAAILVREW